MRKLLAAFTVVLLLGGCAQLQSALNAVGTATQSFENPVTPERLYALENGAVVVFAALNAYRRSCIRGDIPRSCRDNIRAIQVYTRQIPPFLRELRYFVRNNDQTNAIAIYRTVRDLVEQARARMETQS